MVKLRQEERSRLNKLKNFMMQNLGKLDRIFRFILGVWWLGPWAPQFSAGWVNVVIIVIGWIALIESFLGYCQFHKICGIDNTNQ